MAYPNLSDTKTFLKITATDADSYIQAAMKRADEIIRMATLKNYSGDDKTSTQYVLPQDVKPSPYGYYIITHFGDPKTASRVLVFDANDQSSHEATSFSVAQPHRIFFKTDVLNIGGVYATYTYNSGTSEDINFIFKVLVGVLCSNSGIDSLKNYDALEESIGELSVRYADTAAGDPRLAPENLRTIDGIKQVLEQYYKYYYKFY